MPKIAARMSRRTAAKLLGLAAAGTLAGDALGAVIPGAAGTFAYVGTYTGVGGNGKGIYRFVLDARTGALTGSTLVAQGDSPSFLLVHPNRKVMFAANEIANYQGNSGAVSAYAIDPASGDLKLLNQVSSHGAGPAHMALDRTGRWLFVANYAGGTVCVLPISADGNLGEATAVEQAHGSVGAARATNAPAGSFAVSGHDVPHAHMVLPSPDGRWLLSTDLGQDRILCWQFNAAKGTLTSNATAPFTTLPAGDGPRHLAFDRTGRFLFSLQEESSTLVTFSWDSETGRLHALGSVSTLPPGFAGTSFASDLLLSPDGQFLYAGNRLHNSVAVLAVEAGGKLRYLGEQDALGDYPSQFAFDPGGDFLYVCNHRSDNITCFRVNRQTGLLTPNPPHTYIAAPTPGSIAFGLN